MDQITYSEKEIDRIAQSIIKNTQSKILCFYGQMGAGKTTLIKVLVDELGGSKPGNSPTFGLVNEYEGTDGALLGYHFDFYRLNDEIEAYDMGFEEYLNSDCWVFIEWPEKIPSLIPDDATTVQIEIIDPFTRKISLS